jgi:hypothetical protein
MKQTKFFYFDCHIAVFREFEFVLSQLLPDASLDGWLISGHSHLIGREKDQVKIINENTWRSINLDAIEQFKKEYSDYLNNFDAFFVGYPTCFVLLFAHLGKPIIVSNCVRYDMPFCWNKDINMLNQLHQTLNDLNGKGLLSVISNNLADHDYFSYAPHGVSSTLIPTIGEYSEIEWMPSMAESLIYSGETLFTKNSNLISRKDYGSFSSKEIGRFKSIIHVPYEVSTMSMSEQYAGGIPLLFPSEKLLRNWWESDNKLIQSRYWLHNNDGVYPNYLQPFYG